MKFNSVLRAIIISAMTTTILASYAQAQKGMVLKDRPQLTTEEQMSKYALTLTQAIFSPSKAKAAEATQILAALNCKYLSDTFAALQAYKKYAENNANAQMKNIIERSDFRGIDLPENYSLNKSTTLEKYWIDWENNCPDGVRHPNPRSHDGYQRTAVNSGSAFDNWLAGIKGPAPQAYARIFKYALQRCRAEKDPLPEVASAPTANPEEVESKGRAAYQRALKKVTEQAGERPGGIPGGRAPNSDAKVNKSEKENQPTEEKK